MKKIISIIMYFLCGCLALILFVNCVLITQSLFTKDKIPDIFGYFPLVVLSDSMYPTIESGDLVIYQKKTAEDVDVGDLVAFYDPESTDSQSIVTHRIVEKIDDGTGSGYRTKGDANNTEDTSIVPDENIIGVYKLRIPKIGNAVLFVQSALAKVDNSASQTDKIVKLDEWGVVLNVPVNTLVKQYGNGITLTYPEKIEDLTFPGEKGDTGFSIDGTPNANIKLNCDYTVTVKEPENWIIENANNEDLWYFPVMFSLGTGDSIYKSIDFNTDSDVYTYTYPTYESILSKGVTYDKKYIGLNWKWDFEQDLDSYDTALGNYPKDVAPEFEIKATITMVWDDGIYDNNDGGGSESTTTTNNTYTYNTTNNNATLSGNTGDDMPTINGNAGETLSGVVSTGDSFNMLCWICLLALSALVIIVVIRMMIKRSNKEDA